MAHENEQRVADSLEELGGALRRQPSVSGEVMRRVTQHVATNGKVTHASRRGGRRLIGKLAAVAACVVVALLVWSPWGGGGIGASEAFAAAIAQVEAAGTFACRQVVTEPGDDGKHEVRETTYASKEPNLERSERLGDAPETMVTDYARRLRLIVLHQDKTAELQDISTMYSTDPITGQTKPTELGTHARDDVTRISAKAVKDLGRDKLNGRDVWVLQSDNGAEPIYTVWVNPDSGKPVQVEIASPSRGQSFAYTEIQIDGDLDDALFSLDAPAGYAMRGGAEQPVKHLDEMAGKMMSKTMTILRACHEYMNDHDKWPTTLDDLRAAGMDAKVLQALLSAPDSKDGKSVFVYRQPKAGEEDAIVLYEAPEFRHNGKVVAGFTDGHAELMEQKYFDVVMKKQEAAN